ncbi:hypothetical protein CsatB_018362 [Cannabis sativa]
MEISLNLSEGILPSEIIEDILLRLDPKSLIRFKCVSKSWLSLLNNPIFMYTNQKRQPPRTFMGHNHLGDSGPFSIRSYENFDQFSSQVYKFHVKAKEISLVGIDNGVICLREPFNDNDNCFYLWNPAIQKYKKLPPYPCDLSIDRMYGFGYESLTNDFKMVGVTSSEELIVYSMKRNSWKIMVLSNLISDDMGFNNNVSVVVNGSIHWSFCLVNTELIGQNCVYVTNTVVAFDLSREEFKLIKYPSSLKDNEFCIYGISNLSGCLCMVTSQLLENLSPSSCIEIWVMKEYGVFDSWNKYLYVDLINQPLYRQLSVSHNGNLLLLESNNKNILDRNCLFTLSIYDAKASKMVQLQHIGLQKPQGSYLGTYAESIFLS